MRTVPSVINSRSFSSIGPEDARLQRFLDVSAADHVGTALRDGMPILEVGEARHAIVIKRSLHPGFAGIDNALFYEKTTLMLCGNARTVASSLSGIVYLLTMTSQKVTLIVSSLC